MSGLILNRRSGEWNDDDFDVRANGEVVGRTFVSAGGDGGGNPLDDGIRQELGAGVIRPRTH